jgi:hypothetical protein
MLLLEPIDETWDRRRLPPDRGLARVNAQTGIKNCHGRKANADGECIQ